MINLDYPLPCQDSDALFALAGGDAITCMAKVCGVDLRDAAFPSGSIAQTSVAKVNASVVKTVLDGQQFLYILCSQASAQYLWESLVDAMAEFGGEVLGTLPYADVA
ncbi:hypothetical protein [Aliagarivorans marinus]|uniref:hypothetical protein n=1 Tax=Aliagarivorans marinus TaxID=561965 RepID=UPI000428235F|nr:hypothetical protein [Aliagarivorans marinus]